ncbi:c-type cytochrome domain-containing protein [Rhodopirellula halodulae]|uniref:c-type cytochrome domain-containing protein n=1 Tax=Rhodopirellula halodulae TaxID=2894198 RepID=UPI001E55670C|nr:c-type cytochrome domain-containing protein [Rhodopirellula sp. JC737]MCC9658524.1 hypothetical protein [Rhodopirellula sp. JC737]
MMMNRIWIALTAFTLVMSTVPAHAVDYATDIVPLLEKYCVGCHSADDAQGGFAMDSHEALLRGGDSGLAITAGVASSSRLYSLASGAMEPVMPPDDMEGMTPDELEVLAEWIQDGAKGPDGEMPNKRELQTPQIAPKSSARLPITAIAQSSDGRYQAHAKFGSIELLDRESGLSRIIETETGKINSLCFDSSGERLVIATGLTGGYGQAIVYSVAQGQRLLELLEHDDVLYAAEFSPDGKRIATAGYDHRILLWDAESGEMLRELSGHNGAIYDLAFAPDGKHLVSACADETAKVWEVASGDRLDTLSQPEGEVFCVDFTPDNQFILAGSADNRLRVWRFISRENAEINPLIETRFVDESPIQRMAFTRDGGQLVLLCESGNVKVLRTRDWTVVGTSRPFESVATDLVVHPDGTQVSASLMSGYIEQRKLTTRRSSPVVTRSEISSVYLDLGDPISLKEVDLEFNDQIASVPRGAEITGSIDSKQQEDRYQFEANEGEVWMIAAQRTAGDLDPKIRILDEAGLPLVRTRLQAIRDTYFTFRGKDSKQTGDFRLFNWQEIGLNQYLYSNGEVTRTWRHPRGPDSGFDMYPGSGNRHTYFGTTHTTHALGEPAYIVRELSPGESPEPNGLPVFHVDWENDDDPGRMLGNGSQLRFVAPHDGRFTVCVSDTRGHYADDYQYKLQIRPAAPSFTASIGKITPSIPAGAGRKLDLNVKRLDGFRGPVTFDIGGLPPGWHSNFPVTIEPDQTSAEAVLFVPEGLAKPAQALERTITASAEILQRRVERVAGKINGLTIGDKPRVTPMIQPIDRDVPRNEDWTLRVPRGKTVSARIVLRRGKDTKGNIDQSEIRFGKEGSGHNAAHGVYVDNIGLSGLLVLPNENEREFFVTADPVAALGKRSFFLVAERDGGVASFPITIEVTDSDTLTADAN